LTHGTVCVARKRRSFSTGSLMYDSSSRLYISVLGVGRECVGRRVSAGSETTTGRRTPQEHRCCRQRSNAPEWMFSIAIWKP
jgi:hypothetical protein